jgi:hypothetical protein
LEAFFGHADVLREGSTDKSLWLTGQSVYCGANDRYGSNSEVGALPRYFCFAPMNGHRETQRPSPFGAKSGREQMQQTQSYSITSSAKASSDGGTVDQTNP